MPRFALEAISVQVIYMYTCIMNTVPWRTSRGDDVPPPDHPMYVRVPGALGPASGIVNDQHAAHVASIIAIKNQQEAIAKTVSDENNRIRIEQEVRGGVW